MPIKVNGIEVKKIIANSAEASKVIVNGEDVFGGGGVTSAVGTWLFNESLTWDPFDNLHEWNIDFMSNSVQYTQLYDHFNGFLSGSMIYRKPDTKVATVKFGETTWISPVYRTITITGGDDAENSDLTTWLVANAIKQ